VAFFFPPVTRNDFFESSPFSCRGIRVRFFRTVGSFTFLSLRKPSPRDVHPWLPKPFSANRSFFFFFHRRFLEGSCPPDQIFSVGGTTRSLGGETSSWNIYAWTTFFSALPPPPGSGVRRIPFHRGNFLFFLSGFLFFAHAGPFPMSFSLLFPRELELKSPLGTGASGLFFCFDTASRFPYSRYVHTSFLSRFSSCLP